jgi:transglutaminase-like putative cysteine protease
MTRLEWTRPVAAAPAAPGALRRLAGRVFDWEDWLTFALALGAVLGVSLSLESSGWTRDMPQLSLVGILALLFAVIVARSPLPMLLAWPLAALTGAAVAFWQTLEMVAPGSLEQKIDAVYFRFERWFHLAFTGGISNDPLPFNVMVVGLTWLGVFLFGWSVYRWHNAWLGLIPGGVALFLNLLFIDDSLPFAVFLYVMFGFLLLMRTHLMARMREWRADGVSYPSLISLTFLHYTFWAGLFLLTASWIAPVGPFTTPGPVNALVERFEGIGIHLVRLAGPLHVKKIVPVHDYTAVLPFQGSLELSERELLSVEVSDPTIEGPIVLRGAVYEEYASGGWKAGRRDEVDVSAALMRLDRLTDDASGGRIVPVRVTVQAESVIGTVLFTPGRPLSADVPARAKLPPGTAVEVPALAYDYPPSAGVEFRSGRIRLPNDAGASLSDAQVLAAVPEPWIGLSVGRTDNGKITHVSVIPPTREVDVLVVSPQEALDEGESYTALGFIPNVDPDELRAAGGSYPSSVRRGYLRLPDVPERVRQLAFDVAGAQPTAYDRAKAVESYLRGLPVDYRIGDTPPGRDTVDYFLFEAKQGYFDYHASAMVVMLRAVGVPARLAVGFVVDRADFDQEAGAYLVQDQDAYAWVEVYFPEIGWVEFNPSPDRPADLRPTSKSGEIIVPPIDLDDLRDLPVSADVLFPIDPGAAGIGGSGSSGGSGLGYASWIALALAGFLVAVAGSAALGWRRSVAGLPYPQQLWEKTVRLAAWAGLPPQPGQTPFRFAETLSRRFRGVRDIDLLAAAYNRSRFGRKETDAEEKERLGRVWAHVRGPLAWEVIRRLWRRS